MKTKYYNLGGTVYRRGDEITSSHRVCMSDSQAIAEKIAAALNLQASIAAIDMITATSIINTVPAEFMSEGAEDLMIRGATHRALDHLAHALLTREDARTITITTDERGERRLTASVRVITGADNGTNKHDASTNPALAPEV